MKNTAKIVNDNNADSAISEELRKQIEEKLLKASSEKRINCAGALAIAKSLKVPAAAVGQIANSLNLKISNCQLNCF